MHPKTKAIKEALVAQVQALISQCVQRHAELGASNVNIYRGGKKPEFILSAEGSLRRAKSAQEVDIHRLTIRELNAVRWQLTGHLLHISQ